MAAAGELDRLRETIEVLAAPDACRALEDTDDVLVGADSVRSLIAERAARMGL